MIIDKRIRLNDIGDTSAAYGLFLMRVITEVDMTPSVVSGAVFNHIKGEIETCVQSGGYGRPRKENLLKDIDLLAGLEIVYNKLDNYEVGDKKYQYHQIVFEVPDEMSRPDYQSYAGNLVSALSNMYGQYDNITPRSPMGIYAYQIANVKCDRNSQALVVRDNTPEWKQAVLQIMAPEHDITFKVSSDITKKYTRNAIIRYRFEIFDNLDKAFDAKDKDTMYICQYNGYLGAMEFAQVNQDMRGMFHFRVMYKGTPKVTWVNDTVVFYDGKKSLEETLPYIEEWSKDGIKQVDILQFCMNKDFFYQGNMQAKDAFKYKMVLHYINKDKIFVSKSILRYNNGSFGGQILFEPAKGEKRVMLSLRCGGGSPFFGDMVIPVNANGIQSTAMKIVDKMVRCKLNRPVGEQLQDLVHQYRDCFMDGDIDKEEDVLAQWFSFCTKSSKNADDQLLRAYEKMKESLEREYRELGTYLSCYDFSKCMAIPRVTIDEKLKENCYKSLHIEPKNIIIKSINNKKINPIEELRPMISFMVKDAKRGMMYKGEYPLTKFYKQATNEIELFYNRLKGEVIRDKAKNRR